MNHTIHCADCPYYYNDLDDGEICYCHYTWDDGYAPCEVEDEPDLED